MGFRSADLPVGLAFRSADRKVGDAGWKAGATWLANGNVRDK
jgi:hypothetical protein